MINVAAVNICLYDYKLYRRYYKKKKNIYSIRITQLLGFHMKTVKSVLLGSKVVLGQPRGHGPRRKLKRLKYDTTVLAADEIRKKMLKIALFVLVSYILLVSFASIETL